MARRLGVIVALAVAAATMAMAGSAAAQASRTWVSGTGDDVNPCSRTAPCKTFAGAISKTAAGGEIDVIDPGAFGAVTIIKAITIDGYGQIAGDLVQSNNGITINAGSSDNVVLRNIQIKGLGTAVAGVRILGAGSVQLDNLVIQQFQTGIDATAANRTLAVSVHDSTIMSNTVGVAVGSTTGTTRVDLEATHVDGNGTGVAVGSGGVLTMWHGTAAENLNVGIKVAAGPGPATAALDGVLIAGNGTGLVGTGDGSVTRLTDATIVHNGIGADVAAPAAAVGHGHFLLAGNGSDGGVITQGDPVVLEVDAARDAVLAAVTAARDGIVSNANANTATLNGAVGVLNSAIASLNTTVAALAAKAGGGIGPAGVGFNTTAFCAEGSVRNDGLGVLQMYVTLFSETTAQTVTIDYITNKGTFSHTVALAQGVRYTDDVNAFLIGSGGPLAGQPDVDTSVKVTGTAPVFLACPVYFNRSIGAAGQVAGGSVQDGTHN